MNKERKQQFLAAGQYVSRERAFDYIAPYEDELNKDLCDFTKSEIKDWYREQNMRSLTLYAYNLFFAAYTSWCIENNLSTTGKNAYDQITHSDFVDFGSVLLTSPMETMSIARKFANVSDRFLFASVFLGFQATENAIDYTKLTPKDVDDKEYVIHLSFQLQQRHSKFYPYQSLVQTFPDLIPCRFVNF